ncbi:hypothetical protein TRFO_31143 [Tritrichomonas foetus]|uniref:Uncharacterized protein n=1 Tax=Tritrichomonas foetus TaxID=1144522 RepID=A0A1J4JWN7_9EUKA|nr:hypothetical protein TRFO_31143 [Tritrichomonas foetus]|eukprot:OHT01948.1 hypothetical protein TRFO_31143 [Tritrichomonas foetus]
MIPGFDIFMHQLEILKNLQILTISLFDCDASEIEEKSSELFIYFHEIELGNKEQFPIYEAYLHFLKHISLIKKISLKNLNIPYLILKELITNHSLKDNFHQSTIVNLFESNKLLSLFLYDQKVIDQTAWELLIMRCQKTDFTPNHIFLAYCWPEIVENPEIYNEVTALKPTVSNIIIYKKIYRLVPRSQPIDLSKFTNPS